MLKKNRLRLEALERVAFPDGRPRDNEITLHVVVDRQNAPLPGPREPVLPVLMNPPPPDPPPVDTSVITGVRRTTVYHPIG